jgi:hypothetical protein
MKAPAWVLLIGLTTGPLIGCMKPPTDDRSTAAQPTVKWPAKPADGAPVALSFASMAHKDGRFGAELRVFSFSKKAVRALRLTFHFLNTRGVEISRLAYPSQGQPLVGPKAHSTLNITAPIDHRTDKVTVTLDTVVFMDSTGWTRKSSAP